MRLGRGPARRLLGAVLVAPALFAAAPSHAQTPEERAALDRAVEAFAAMGRAGDVAGVLRVGPPRHMAELARERGMTPEDMVRIVEEGEGRYGIAVTYERFDVHMDRAVVSGTSDSAYAIIPMEMVASEQNVGRMTIRGALVAVMEEGHWYIASPTTPQAIASLIRLYPQLAGVEIPGPDVTVEPQQ